MIALDHLEGGSGAFCEHTLKCRRYRIVMGGADVGLLDGGE
jgi:hypothetical protein